MMLYCSSRELQWARSVQIFQAEMVAGILFFSRVLGMGKPVERAGGPSGRLWHCLQPDVLEASGTVRFPQDFPPACPRH